MAGERASVVPANSDAAKSLALLLKSTGRWQAKLEAALRGRESGWHRLAVKIEGGRVMLVQMMTEETATAGDEVPGA